MTHKTNAKIFRTPLIKEWPSKWFALKHQYKENLVKDLKIKDFLIERLKDIGYSKIEIEREVGRTKVIIYTPKPGLIIGRGGTDIEKLKKGIVGKFLEKGETLEINIIEEKAPNLSAQVLLMEAVADLEKRVSYRRVLKKTITNIKTGRGEGGKVIIKGRLDGVEIARSEKMRWGRLPLTTIRADIDYASGKAQTLYGAIGVKIWIYRGEVFKINSKVKKAPTGSR
ncbi:30S ribosomal protein S3 [bacterium (Candidatus Moisslbacteria) CG12_big_fil_rev_8_21_14_0_65_36_11]|nr:30S ribosomal protein S3 [Candidatus Kuenenbacteria bacterium]OIP76368.1 MAG: 30S ribosomal protein S3 [Parcubacteria group bacterium CG2_30_36_38]PIV45993.1 MAG: 30S ribosomal protein S3 [bacterium (Candidatus Moisslbacteria) CG02_land_8_20_14_3_00_36_53]PIW68131.1 MAG: 30S ribosomal protein S3 [bacterium (Candidatus Moisslbacteria) CG12_big_fil_rev_8_21_14_0_65_36_11]PIZ90466.1 MAG: 30S ribosomal protein S3 [bacterium (Candidatus Moisslbacteria) CG_4_10_14_0_2_um_filter_36_61]PJC00893.1 M